MLPLSDIFIFLENAKIKKSYKIASYCDKIDKTISLLANYTLFF